MDTLHISSTESSTMKAREKLAILVGDGGDISAAELGRELFASYGLKSGANLVYKWIDGTRSFTMRNRRAVEHIVGKPPNFLEDDDAPAPKVSASARAVLDAFLKSKRAAEMDPPPTLDEIALLLEHKVDGEVTENYFYHQLKAERSRRKHPTNRPNLATSAAKKAGITKVRQGVRPAKKAPRKTQDDGE